MAESEERMTVSSRIAALSMTGSGLPLTTEEKLRVVIRALEELETRFEQLERKIDDLHWVANRAVQLAKKRT
jgi:hypothetical protein